MTLLVPGSAEAKRLASPDRINSLGPIDPMYLPKPAFEAVRELYLNVLRNGFDFLVVLVGREGFGKSTLAMGVWLEIERLRLHWGLPRTFTDKNLVYQPEEYTQCIRDCNGDSSDDKAGQVLLYDEAGTGLYNREGMGIVNREVNKILMQCRVKRMVHLMCLPNFFALDAEVRLRRVMLLFVVKGVPRLKKIVMPSGAIEEYHHIEKGYLAFYSADQIHKIWRDPRTGFVNYPKTVNDWLRFQSCQGTPEWTRYVESSKAAKQRSLTRSVDKIKKRTDDPEPAGASKLTEFVDESVDNK